MTYRAAYIDGGLAVRAWKASGSLRPFVRQLLKVREVYRPGVLGIAWDAPREQSWRRQRSAEYKANREPVQAGFTAALEALRADLPCLDVLQFSAPTCEADDVLYSLSVTTPGTVLLVSGDKDLLQALRPGVDLLKTGSDYRHPDQLITAEKLPSTTIKLAGAAVTGLDAHGWGSLLALCGDTTDGVAGLPGVGPKKALDILEACPEFVELLLKPCPECKGSGQRWLGGERETSMGCEMCEGDGADGHAIAWAREQCYAKSATAARWVERAIEHLPELRLSRELVTLRLVEVDCVDAEPDAERAAEVLRAAHLEAA